MNRIGSYIQTNGGKLFWPLDPRAEEVDLDDIAHALSQMCRWTSHTKEFYSVAQHAVLVATLVQPMAPHLALAALHHDSAEAYLSDICSPTKRYLQLRYENYAGVEIVESFNDAENRIAKVIFLALGIQEPDARGWAAIKTADLAALRYEAQNLMPPFPKDDSLYSIGLIDKPWHTSWEPYSAKQAFLTLHEKLTNHV